MQEMINPTLSIILPTYNERENILILIPEIEKLFQKNKKFLLKEIIVVDDYSTDDTSTACHDLNKRYSNIIVLQKKKEGIGAALRYGYDHAQGDIILSMDSDLSFSVADIPRLLTKIKDGNDLVLGSRHLLYGGYEKQRFATKIKGFVSSVGNKIITRLLNIPIHDFSGNFRAIRRDVWKKINVIEKTNLMLLEMIIKSQKAGLSITEIPVFFQERKYGKSKLNLWTESFRFLYKLFLFSWR